MSLALNKPKLDNLAGDIWKSAVRLRGKFKAYEYQNVILPIIVIRRLECVLIKWREDKAAEVIAKRPKLTEKDLAKPVKGLETSTAPFSNKTDWTLRKVYEEDHTLLEENFRAYINGFSKNVDDIIEHFNYRATIGQMVKNNRLAPILDQYKELELGPDKLSPLEMGYIYEESLRRLVDNVFILTDRKSLDTNIRREDIEKFTHLKDIVGLIFNSNKYGVWNSRSHKVLNHLDRLPYISSNFGESYVRFNSELIKFADELKTTLVHLDVFLWWLDENIIGK